MGDARRRTERGAAVVDFVLVLVVVVPLFLGIFQVALVLHVRNTLTAAASEGARYAATVDRPVEAGAARTRRADRRRARGPLRPRGHRSRGGGPGRAGCRGRGHRRGPAAGHLGSRRSGSTSPATPSRRPPRDPARRRRDQRGTALVEVTWLSILLLVPLVYVVLAVFEVQRSAFAVNAATRAAGRAYTLAPVGGARATARARAAAAVALRDQGLDLRDGQLALTCDPDPRDCLSPGSVVRVRMALPVALPLMPAALGGNTPSVRVEAEQSVPYGTFREDRS